MMRQANPHFIELKSYMHIGMSTQRLEKNNMLEMSEIRNFASQLHDKMTEFSIMDESEISRVIVLQNHKRYINRWING
jgi:tRNA wybutosine-synthesizing protein 1